MFPKFNNLENLWNSEKFSNTLSVQVIKKKIPENKFVIKYRITHFLLF